MENDLRRIVLLPDKKFAMQQMIYNSLWFALLLECLIGLIMVLSFPRFFFIDLPKYYKVLFSDGTAGNVFFTQMFWAMLMLYTAAAISRLMMLYLTMQKKQITVTLDEEGIKSRYGFFSQYVSWQAYKSITKTDYPVRMKFNAGKTLLVHSAFNQDSIRKKIREYQQKMPKNA